MPWDVVGLGECSVDRIIRLAALPTPGSKHELTSHRVLIGGQVATTLATCASLGLRSAYIGPLGGDDNGRRVSDELIARGVDVSHAARRGVPNRHAVVLVDESSGERTVLWERDARLNLEPAELPRDVIAAARVVHVDDVDMTASIEAARIARAAGVVTTSDIERAADRTGELVTAVAIPIMAADVPGALTGEGDHERALRALRRRHAGMLCVTLGARGALLLDGDMLYHEPAVGVNVVDTTGAGDVFRGAFIYALLRGDSPPAILRFATAAAAVSCTREGAMAGVPQLSEITARLTG